ncbi:hypothetical protein C8R45DRAFT_1124450 [Mycena sanguinolenta]|nr:hypothetical protein C8R45DRAFT_1124450 [Mycena sanguinolenta]
MPRDYMLEIAVLLGAFDCVAAAHLPRRYHRLRHARPPWCQRQGYLDQDRKALLLRLLPVSFLALTVLMSHSLDKPLRSSPRDPAPPLIFTHARSTPPASRSCWDAPAPLPRAEAALDDLQARLTRLYSRFLVRRALASAGGRNDLPAAGEVPAGLRHGKRTSEPAPESKLASSPCTPSCSSIGIVHANRSSTCVCPSVTPPGSISAASVSTCARLYIGREAP